MEHVLFLTSCINPNGMIHTSVQDIEQRRNEYIKSLKFYIANTDKKILFVDNSGEDISSYFQGIEPNRLEILSFNGNKNKAKGKGYGEMEIIEYALNNSKFINNSDLIIKITGRYIVANINNILKQSSQKTNIDIIATFYKNLRSADSRVFVCREPFLHRLILKKDMINDNQHIYFESVFSKTILESISIYNETFNEYKYKPRYKGVNGTSGKNYNSNIIWFIKDIKQKIRYYLN